MFPADGADGFPSPRGDTNVRFRGRSPPVCRPTGRRHLVQIGRAVRPIFPDQGPGGGPRAQATYFLDIVGGDRTDKGVRPTPPGAPGPPVPRGPTRPPAYATARCFSNASRKRVDALDVGGVVAG
jgi:hypothetical protein